MAGVTPNVRLNLPTYDQPGWDTLVNSNFQVIDSLLGQLSTIPSYTGVYVPGASYTTGQTITDPATGFIWQANSNFTTLSTNTFAQEVAANPSHWTNVTTVTNNAAVSASQAASSASTALAAQTAAAASQTAAAGSASAAAASATTATASAAAIPSPYKNKLINASFGVAQMNAYGSTVPVTGATAYVNDNWQVQSVGAPTLTGQFRVATAGEIAAIGSENAGAALQGVVSGTTNANDGAFMFQQIESVSQLSNKTVVLSFWASATVGGVKIGVELYQSFGTGGSPSSAVTAIGTQQFTLTTTPTLYQTSPIVIPSDAGKTFGTNNNDNTGVVFWLSAGAGSLSARASGIGPQTCTVSIFRPQLEIGSTPTPFEFRSGMFDLPLCQRYYEKGTYNYAGYATAGGTAGITCPFKVQKRAIPSFSLASPGGTNLTGQNFVTIANNFDSVLLSATATALGMYSAFGVWIADARL